MQNLSRVEHEPECQLAHDMIDRLSVIIGNCDLLIEKTPKDSPLLERMLVIRNQAHLVARELGQFQCDLIRLRTLHNPEKAEKGTGTRSA
jgi:hypothetical protein